MAGNRIGLPTLLMGLSAVIDRLPFCAEGSVEEEDEEDETSYLPPLKDGPSLVVQGHTEEYRVKFIDCIEDSGGTPNAGEGVPQFPCRIWTPPKPIRAWRTSGWLARRPPR